jgi:hypothetical protein
MRTCGSGWEMQRRMRRTARNVGMLL